MIKVLTAEVVDEVLERTAAASYLKSMWHFMLEHAELDDDKVARSEQCDAVPYVPVQPESLGMLLYPESRVLDIGCLGGYGIYDFLMRRQRLHLPLPNVIGIDLDQASIQSAKALAERWDSGRLARFERASSDALPLEDNAIDFMVARLVLPYVHLQPTLAEIARVLAPGGMLLIQSHAPRYYAKKWRSSFPNPRRVFYCTRPLVGGLLFALTHKQCSREMALSNDVLQGLLAGIGLAKVWQGGFPAKPLFVFRK